MTNPLKYYRNNVFGSICLFESCVATGVENIVVSSTACVYFGADCELLEDT